MADIIDINVYETVETVTINAQPNLTTINVNSVTSAPQVNSDWNATSGVEEILNKPTIPTQTSQLTNNGADGTNPFITALDIPTAGQAGTLVREVKNMTGATLTKGTVVYISGANGNKPLVSKALATTDALSSRTFGLLQSSISNNGLGYCVIIGDLSGLDTSAFTEGAQLYLSGVTAGTYTDAKILAPTHLVYVGKVTRSHPTQGQIEVGIQNGYELEEIHDVAISSVADKQLLSYDVATDLWKNKSVTTADIADSTNKRYQTDNQQSYNDATSSIQTQLNSKGTFTLPSLTSGSVLFSNGTTIAQDNANLFWDNTNKRLGIGTITPTHGLNVYTTIADTGILLDSNTNPAFIIKRAGVERLKLSAAGAVGTVNGLGNGLGFHTDSVERMRISSAGNVGIGTASPTAKLQIELADNGISTVFKSLGGQIRLRGYLSANYGGVIESYNALGTLNERLTISASKIQLLDGNVLVNTFTDNGGKLQIKAGGALSTDIALRVRNSADTADLTSIKGNGDIFLGGTVSNLQLYPTDANYYVANNGHFFSKGTFYQAFLKGASNADICLSIGKGTSAADASSILDLTSTVKGFLPPRMTTTEKNAIASPASGLVVYDTTLNKLCVRGASAWETITSI